MNLPPRQHGTVDDDPEDTTGGADERSEGNGALVMSGCNNGCCDFDWLSTFWWCPAPWDFNWFLCNYGWSFANGNDEIFYDGFVCSAEGTSTYKVTVDGDGGIGSVPRATWKTYSWTAGWVPIFGWDEEDVRSTANSSASPHLHTYCGGMEN